MLVVSRFRVPASETDAFRADAAAALAAFAARPGYRSGTVGRAADEPDLWVVATRWDGVGAYRRSLSGYEVKLHGAPLLARALPEPSAFEVLEEVAPPGGTGASRPSDRAADAAEVAVGEAAGPGPTATAR